MATYYNPKIVTNNLFLYLDAANAKSYPGSGTAWKDLSGQNNDTTLVNGPTYNSNNSGCFVFDGTDDYLEVEAEIERLQPELILGSQMERHIGKRMGIGASGDTRSTDPSIHRSSMISPITIMLSL